MNGLRAAEAADWPAIAALLRQCGLPEAGAREHLDGFRLIARDGALLACAALERHGRHGLLRSVAVAESARGARLGDALVAALVAEARASGLHDLALLTTSAADYFARRGFVRVPREALAGELGASAELRGACPASAVAMRLELRGAGAGDGHAGPGAEGMGAEGG